VLVALSAVAAMAAPALAAASSSPSPSPTPRSTIVGKAPATKTKGVDFGAGPATATKIDGRPFFSYPTTPGSVTHDHIAIQNVATSAVSLIVYPTDAVAGSGSIGYLDRGAKLTDVGSWLTVQTPGTSGTVTVAAGATIILPFTLTIPSGASPGDHTGGIAVAELAAVSGPSTRNATFEQRVVNRVYVRVSGPIHATMAVTELKADYHGTVNPVGAGGVSVSYVVRNTGNVNLSGHQKVTVSGMFGAKHIAVADVPLLLPGESAPVRVSVGNVWPQVIVKGAVHVTPIAQPGELDPPLVTSSASTTVWAVPWSLMVIVVVLVALLAAWLWLRHRASGRTSAHTSHSRAKTKSKSHAKSKSKSKSSRSQGLGEATP
jgi:hypothetical protein